MRYFKIIIFSSIVSLFFLQCKKDKKDKDEITVQTLNGMVFNNCTDSGLAGVKVYFKTIKDNSVISSRETVSDANGNFSFSNAEIHSNDAFQYSIYIPSVSGIGAQLPEHSIFNGTSIYFSKNDASTFLKPRVTPGYFNFCFKINNSSPITSPDSISYYFEQKTLKKNEPSITFGYPNNSATGKGIMFTNLPVLTTMGCTGTRWMGKWKIVVEKRKSGVYTIQYDSIYIPWKGSATYTINW